MSLLRNASPADSVNIRLSYDTSEGPFSKTSNSKTRMKSTRYLYEKVEVEHSLLFALLDRRREEALFWTYELYFSGFEEELETWLRWVYYTFYAQQNTLFTELFEIHLSRLRTLPIPDERDCLFGTIVSNLAHRAYTIQPFTLEYLKMDIPNLPIEVNNHPFLIRFCPRDLAPYQTVDVSSVRPFDYLRTVSRYPIRKNESLFLQKVFPILDEDLSFDGDWVQFITETPYWQTILQEYPSFVPETATFDSEEEFDEFYAKYGFDPDEQPAKIQIAHGADIRWAGIFSAISPETFYSRYSENTMCSMLQRNP